MNLLTFIYGLLVAVSSLNKGPEQAVNSYNLLLCILAGMLLLYFSLTRQYLIKFERVSICALTTLALFLLFLQNIAASVNMGSYNPLSYKIYPNDLSMLFAFIAFLVSIAATIRRTGERSFNVK